MFDEDDYLLLSGLQHFSFCRRQWALIHIEDQWAENRRTTEGELMHERAHDASLRERRGDVITVRGVSLGSPTLGVSGKVCRSLPARGGWIEIRLKTRRSRAAPSLPARGGWIEIPVPAG